MRSITGNTNQSATNVADRRIARDSTPGYAGFRGAKRAHVYNEAAFRHFLAIERSRAERRRRSLLVVVVAIGGHSRRGIRLPRPASIAIFKGLSASLRDVDEVDIVGWLREGHVAAALLIQGPQAPTRAATGQIAARVRRAIEGRLSAALAPRLRVHIVWLSIPIG